MKNKREFIREKRREIKMARKVYEELLMGCMMNRYFDGTNTFAQAVMKMGDALELMDAIMKEPR